MRTFLLLFALLPFFAAGCGETDVAVKDEKPATQADATGDSAEEMKLDYVDAASLETTLADNAVTLVDFTAKW